MKNTETQVSPFEKQKIEMLSSKSTYKNKREFCDAIGADYEKYKSGKAWSNLVGILSQCAGTIEQDGRRITFSRYETIKPYEGNQRNTKFLPVLEYLIVEQLLSACEQSPDGFATVVYRFRELAKNLYLINDMFLPDVHEVFKDDIPKNLTTSRFEAFYQTDKAMIRGYVERALKRLQKEDEIRFYEARIVTIDKGERFRDNPHYLLTPEQDRRYAEIKLDLCAEYTNRDGTPCMSVADIVVAGHTKDFFEKVARKADLEFGGRIDSVYVIHATAHLMEHAQKRLHNIQFIKEKGVELNKLVQESLCQSKQLLLPRNKVCSGFGQARKERYNLLRDDTRAALVQRMHAIDDDTALRYAGNVMGRTYSLDVVGVERPEQEQNKLPA